jgi:tetratricopeptide (TPR) repeat protein
MKAQYLRWVGAVLVFGVSFATYTLTLQSSVPFWDCGEFSAAIALQQVPHPPGASLFVMMGKLFHLLPFGDPGWRMNWISALMSSVASLFLYLLLVLLLERLWKVAVQGLADALQVYGSAVVGALALTYSDTVWFNAVESEVYATSLAFVAVVLYLGFLWYVRAEQPGSERYLLLAAYLVGLSIGVHLLSILAVPGILFLVVFRQYGSDPATARLRNVSYLLRWFGIPALGFAIVYWGITQWFPALLAGDFPFRTEAREHVIEDSPVVAIATVLFVLFLGWRLVQAYRRQRAGQALVLSSVLGVILGFTTYAHVLIRANSHPPMNENEPTTLARLISYLGREQYGETPLWPRRYRYDDPYYSQHYSRYGAWYPPQIERVQRRDGSTVPVPRWRRVNLAGELSYLWNYQISHMYLRYFFWNYVGRMSDVQDAPAAGPLARKKDALPYNYDSGYADAFPVRFYGLPLLLGILGMLYHFQRDRRTAWVMLVTFLLMGVLAAIAQNQQLPQPRERDYFYVGSFFVFCCWIGLGAYSVTEMVRRWLRQPVLGAAVGTTLTLLAAPVLMAVEGWRIHDRSGNYLPFDHSYNILQSCERDAILFTNGDNDTFPLWYLQDVAGVRRDIRVVNLSLGNTLWYIRQLKHREPHGAKRIPLSFPDEALESEDSPRALQPELGEARPIAIPVRREILERFTQDTAILRDGHMRFTFVGMPWRQEQNRTIYLFRVQDKLILDILQQTRFERPVYFSITVGSDAYAGLDRFLRLEGMVYRVCPVAQNTGQQGEAIEPRVMEACLMNVDNSNNYHTEPHYGFKFRNLNNLRVYYDEVHRRLIANYRMLYLRYAAYLLEQQDSAKAVAVLDAMNSFISPRQFPLSYWLAYNVAQLYNRAGAKQRAQEFARMAAAAAELVANTPEIAERETAVQYYNPRWLAAEAYQLAGEYEQARLMLQQLLLEYPNDATLQARYNEMVLERLEAQGRYREALDTAQALLARYDTSGDATLRGFVPQLRSYLERLRRKLGDTAAGDTTGRF